MKMLAANLAAWLAPGRFRAEAGRRFVTPRARRQSDTGRAFLNTLQAEDFAGPGGRQRAWTGGQGPLVMFQHGWEADSADLATLAEAVMARGCSVCLIDGPAHGQSEGRQATLLDFAAGIAAAARAFGEPDAVAAHSMGFPATVIAMDRHGLSPRRVAGLAGPDALTANVSFQGRRMGMSQTAIKRLLDAVSWRLGEPADGLSVLHSAPRLRAEALIVHGREDVISPPEAGMRIAAAWPGAQLELMDAMGHRAVLRHPDVVERVSAFLAPDAQPMAPRLQAS
ncbi:alpha/beta hydrolase [Alkalicaulis satelles]|uniref:Alpha/beta hydrolase n=1 Tax=Alkalicaulis satelles TaxID=2609175 RepID=A0A5M6ZSP9_9PROT|nr:alpha/beta hydrolase [Alkalicaulis satelles]KAA5805351.1 alpha/beta hydrolase [Alkalicaulis satelles]